MLLAGMDFGATEWISLVLWLLLSLSIIEVIKRRNKEEKE